ncbi:helix-turn-helix domain-containing protein [Fibrella forsythiae]|uniref:AraC family transcriptional regulator n=1 Tax=Fibrella forsythiae TaxID=2817061 RepID=A0ABS3JSP3_9BACT|nr:helix-turn-helix domain-containing protein [Fibrella forsythiae]MBO0953029.1 AraC family transcriptional regulator [Fibrella forsythiae]
MFDIELLFGLGPSLYLFVKASTNSPGQFIRRYYWHYLPVALEFSYYLTPAYRQVQHHLISWPSDTSHWLWLVEQAGAVISLLTYLYLTSRWLSRHKKELLSSPGQQQILRWLEKPVRFYALFWLAWLGLRTLDVGQFGESLPINAYYPLLVLLSGTSCWIGFVGYTYSYPEQGLTVAVAANSEALLSQDHSAQLDQLRQAMETDQLYLNAQLSLAHLAQHVHLNPRLVSKVLNEGLGKSFYEFVNAYRVEAVKEKLVNARYQHLTFLGLAFESGFNSKATFNYLFKKHTGLTPKQYVAAHHQANSGAVNRSESTHSDDSPPDDT